MLSSTVFMILVSGNWASVMLFCSKKRGNANQMQWKNKESLEVCPKESSQTDEIYQETTVTISTKPPSTWADRSSATFASSCTEGSCIRGCIVVCVCVAESEEFPREQILFTECLLCTRLCELHVLLINRTTKISWTLQFSLKRFKKKKKKSWNNLAKFGNFTKITEFMRGRAGTDLAFVTAMFQCCQEDSCTKLRFLETVRSCEFVDYTHFFPHSHFIWRKPHQMSVSKYISKLKIVQGYFLFLTQTFSSSWTLKKED